MQFVEGRGRTEKLETGEFALAASWNTHHLPLDIVLLAIWQLDLSGDLDHCPPWFSGVWALTGTTPLAFLGLQLSENR